MTATISLEKTREDADGEGFVILGPRAGAPLDAIPPELTSGEVRDSLRALGLSDIVAQTMIDSARLAYLRDRSLRSPAR
jgi:hypothetical protein